MEAAVLEHKAKQLYDRQVVLKVAKPKYNFLMELLGNFDFVRIEDENACDSHEEILANLKQTAKDFKLLKAGKLETRPARELLKEL